MLRRGQQTIHRDHRRRVLRSVLALRIALRSAPRGCGLAVVLATAVISGSAGSAAAGTVPAGFRAVSLCPRARTEPSCTGLMLVPSSRSLSTHEASGRPAVVERPNSSGLTPQQLHAAYQLPPETASSGSQTVALVELGGDPTAEADLEVFDKQFGLPPCTKAHNCFSVINQEGNSSPLPSNNYRAGETSLDVDMVRAVCEDCHIIVVEGKPEEGIFALRSGVNSAVTAGATEVSTSIEWYYADTEAEEAAFLRETDEKYYTHPGVVITASSGDCGYDDENEAGERFAFCKGRAWHYPGFPGKLGNVVSVGGTNLFEHEGAWESTAWTNAGSGCTSIFAAPLWQTSLPGWPATGCGTERSVADVSAVASCKTGVDAYDTTVAPDWYEGKETGWGVACGTSVASPIVAAEFALAGGARGESPLQTLYSHAGESTAFYDVVEGSNGTCGGKTECQAAVGYDGPTGLGSPIGLWAFSLTGAPVDTSLPTISGTAEQGQTLTAHPGAWENSPTSSGLQWEDCNSAGTGCLPIQGATGATYTLAVSDENNTIRVVETAGNASGYGPSAASEQTASVLSALEYGTCVKTTKVDKHYTGKYEDKNCTKGKSEGEYEWAPTPEHSEIKTTDKTKAVTLKSASVSVVCKKSTSEGEITGRTTDTDTVTYTSCAAAGKACTSAGEPAGTIKTNLLDSSLLADHGEVWTRYESSAPPYLEEFECGGIKYRVKGSVAAVDSCNVNVMATKDCETFAEGKGEQHLELEVVGGASETAAEITAATSKSATKIEIKTA
jgi:hypothetical protein